MLDDLLARAAWASSRGATPPASEAEIRERSRCSPATAFRVLVLQRGACAPILALWQEGTITLVQVLRITLAAPFDEQGQEAEACAASPVARALLTRE